MQGNSYFPPRGGSSSGSPYLTSNLDSSMGVKDSYGSYDTVPSFGASYGGGATGSFQEDSSQRDRFGTSGQYGSDANYAPSYGNQASFGQDGTAYGTASNYDCSSGSNYGFSFGSGGSSQGTGGSWTGQGAARNVLKRPASRSEGPSPMKKGRGRSMLTPGGDLFDAEGSEGSFMDQGLDDFSQGGQSWGDGAGGRGKKRGQRQGFGRGRGQSGLLPPSDGPSLVNDLSNCTIEQLHMALKLVKEGFVPSSSGRGSLGMAYGMDPGNRGLGTFRGRGRGRGGLLNQDFRQGFPMGNLKGAAQGWGRGQTSPLPGRGGRGGRSQQLPFDPKSLTKEESLKRFCQFLRDSNSKVNDIQTVENAITATHLELATEFKSEELLKRSNKVFFTASLTLSGVFLARCAGGNKKELKHECYKQGLHCLKTMTVPQLLKLKDKGIEAVKKELEESLSVEGEKGKTAATALTPTSPAPAPGKAAAGASPAKKGGPDTGLEAKLQKLIYHLQTNTTQFDNKVSELTAALNGSRCKIEHSTDIEPVRLNSGLPWFKCKLMFGSLSIACSSASSKKASKVKTFDKAIVSLRTKPIKEILAGAPEDYDLPADEGILPAKPSRVKSEPAPAAEPCAKKFTLLIEKVLEFPEELTEVINALDTSTGQLQIVPTCIYSKLKKTEPGTSSQCDLYLDGLLIATGTGDKRRDSQNGAYTKAVEILKSTTPQTLITSCKRLTAEAKVAPGVVDVCVKGFSSQHDSNRRQLQAIKATEEELSQAVDCLVLLEHDDWVLDRRRHAFSILNKSATQCGMLLAWSLEPYFSYFKCEMQLQHQLVGESFARSKNEARALAAADAVFKFYRTQPVIKMSSHKADGAHWLEASKVYEEVKKLEEAAALDPSKVPASAPAGEHEEAVSLYFTQVISNYIAEFKEKDTIEELIFGTGLTVPERKEIQHLGKRHKLRYHNRHLNEMGYIALSQDRKPQQIVEILRSNPSASRKHTLVEPSSLPKHQDIQHLLLSVEEVHAKMSSEIGPGSSGKKAAQADESK